MAEELTLYLVLCDNSVRARGRGPRECYCGRFRSYCVSTDIFNYTGNWYDIGEKQKQEKSMLKVVSRHYACRKSRVERASFEKITATTKRKIALVVSQAVKLMSQP